MTNVVIPNSVISIGEGAFLSCPKLTNAVIGNGVSSIGESAFSYCSKLTSITIGSSVTNIGSFAFENDNSLTNLTVGCPSIGTWFSGFSLKSVTMLNSVTNIGSEAFNDCTKLTHVTIPNSVISIGTNAFAECSSLTNVTIPGSVTNIGAGAFADCTSLTSVYFQGNAPISGSGYSVFSDDNNMTIYYLPETTGWNPNLFFGIRLVLWNPQVQTESATFGIQTNQFGFTITGTNGLVVVVQACTNLADPVWVPLATQTLTGGSFYFKDLGWTNHSGRFYRLSSP